MRRLVPSRAAITPFYDPNPDERRLRTLLGLAASIGGLGIVLTEGIYRADTGIPWAPVGLLLVGLGNPGVLRPRRTTEQRA